MKMSRQWAMSSPDTFKISPITELINRYLAEGEIWADPFVRNSIFKERCTFTNDLNPKIKADCNLEATEFLKLIPSGIVDGVLFDPPYSPRQIQECYGEIGIKVFTTDTNSSFYSLKKDEISRILRVGGLCISFGWNSVGMGKKRGFEILEILLVSHGGNKNDTIVTVEIKRTEFEL